MNMHTGTTELSKTPRWQLTGIYSSLSGEDYLSDKARLSELLTVLTSHASDRSQAVDAPGEWLRRSIALLSEVSALYGTLSSFAYASFSVDTANPLCIQELNKLESLAVPLQPSLALFRTTLAEYAHRSGTSPLEPDLARFEYIVAESLALARHQMTPEEEALAADLARSGAEAFTRLQEGLSSSLSFVWDEATGERKTMVELRGMAHDPDRSMRQKAFKLELSGWHQHRIAFAAGLNGVKGTAATLAGRRGWKDALDHAVFQSRISHKTLESLIAAMKASLPDFRRYMRAKAKMLGVGTLAFYDLFAPISKSAKRWSFAEARDYIVDRFASFSKDLADFAAHAFDNEWIDAEPRAGKVGGAYCIDFPLRNQTRIMVNFTGTFDSVVTIAHELGHAWHSYLLKDTDYLLRDYPMTLAETASLFCETLVYSDELARTSGDERLALLEMRLSDLNQIIVDILSRFIFESDVFARRKESELSPDEFCELMTAAQKTAYGNGLDADALHPYMWAVKGHYYHANLNFYNYPYSFGQLFGLGLYRLYQEKPEGFRERYSRLLMRTGSLGAVELCRDEGIDIESQEFWTSALALVRTDIDQFCSMAEVKAATGGSK